VAYCSHADGTAQEAEMAKYYVERNWMVFKRNIYEIQLSEEQITAMLLEEGEDEDTVNDPEVRQEFINDYLYDNWESGKLVGEFEEYQDDTGDTEIRDDYEELGIDKGE
jgi:hypothetical protein